MGVPWDLHLAISCCQGLGLKGCMDSGMTHAAQHSMHMSIKNAVCIFAGTIHASYLLDDPLAGLRLITNWRPS